MLSWELWVGEDRGHLASIGLASAKWCGWSVATSALSSCWTAPQGALVSGCALIWSTRGAFGGNWPRAPGAAREGGIEAIGTWHVGVASDGIEPPATTLSQRRGGGVPGPPRSLGGPYLRARADLGERPRLDPRYACHGKRGGAFAVPKNRPQGPGKPQGSLAVAGRGWYPSIKPAIRASRHCWLARKEGGAKCPTSSPKQSARPAIRQVRA